MVKHHTLNMPHPVVNLGLNTFIFPGTYAFEHIKIGDTLQLPKEYPVIATDMRLDIGRLTPIEVITYYQSPYNLDQLTFFMEQDFPSVDILNTPISIIAFTVYKI